LINWISSKVDVSVHQMLLKTQISKSRIGQQINPIEDFPLECLKNFYSSTRKDKVQLRWAKMT
jgi:hypothetical protein